MDRFEVTRRSLLRRALLTPWINLVGLIGCASHRAPAGPSPSAVSDLSPGEMDDLIALGEVLVEGRTLAPAERRHLVEHIQDRTRRGAEYLETYRTTASTLDRLADGRFASLDMRERTVLIVRYRLVPRRPARRPRRRSLRSSKPS